MEENRAWRVVLICGSNTEDLSPIQECRPVVAGILIGKPALKGRYFLASDANPMLEKPATTRPALKGRYNFYRSLGLELQSKNKLHWLLDVAFSENASKKCARHVAQNFTLKTKMALNII